MKKVVSSIHIKILWRVSTALAPHIHNLNARRQSAMNFTPQPLNPQGNNFGTHEEKAGLAPGPVWMVLENRKYLALARIQTPRPHNP